MIRHSHIGVDYQPPTPAPSTAHHIIGDDDDMPDNPATAFYKAPSMPKPHSIPRHPASNRLHSVDPSLAFNLHNRSNTQTKAAQGSMGPPTGGFAQPRNIHREASKNLKLNLEKTKQTEPLNPTQDINKIFSEMINPLGEEVAMMPPPLSAIITPKVSQHEGNNARLIPKYFPVPMPAPAVSPLKDSPEVSYLKIREFIWIV